MTRASAKITAALALAAALSACARHRAETAVAVPVAPIPPRPVLNAAYDGVVVPPVGADGHYQTINTGIGAQQAIWHVRAALNVAALSCRGPGDDGIIPAYNALLKSKKAVFAKANKTVAQGFRPQGAGWQDAYDRYMTQLYNYFAMPQASAPFCQAAAMIAPRAEATDAAAWPDFAPTALLELEAPILAVYQTIDAYKVQLADWDAHHGPDAPPVTQLAMAPAAPQPKPAKKGKPPRLEYHLDYEPIDVVLDWSPHSGAEVTLR